MFSSFSNFTSDKICLCLEDDPDIPNLVYVPGTHLDEGPNIKYQINNFKQSSRWAHICIL